MSAEPSTIEEAVLEELRRLPLERQRLPEEVLVRVERSLEQPGVGLALAPLDLEVARAVGRIPREDVPDMPDRIIAATALRLGVPLVTRDGRIRASQVETIW